MKGEILFMRSILHFELYVGFKLLFHMLLYNINYMLKINRQMTTVDISRQLLTVRLSLFWWVSCAQIASEQNPVTNILRSLRVERQVSSHLPYLIENKGVPGVDIIKERLTHLVNNECSGRWISSSWQGQEEPSCPWSSQIVPQIAWSWVSDFLDQLVDFYLIPLLLTDLVLLIVAH